MVEVDDLCAVVALMWGIESSDQLAQALTLLTISHDNQRIAARRGSNLQAWVSFALDHGLKCTGEGLGIGVLERDDIGLGSLLVVDNALSHAEEVQPLKALIEADKNFSSMVLNIGAGLLLASSI